MRTVQNHGRLQIAWRAAQDFYEGAYINLGVGIPTEASRFVPGGREVIFHSENGILGVSGLATGDSINRNLVNASQQYVMVQAGACYFDCCESFAMLRGGHVDIAFLGGYEVSEAGDLANWDRRKPGVPPAVGGAMDIAIGAKAIWVGMEHCTTDGKPRLVREISLPRTGARVVSRVYTDLAIIDVTPRGGVVREIHPAMNMHHLREVTEWRLVEASDLHAMQMPDIGVETVE
jgi:3-oxoadipate CoA-transferase, beta subunit